MLSKIDVNLRKALRVGPMGVRSSRVMLGTVAVSAWLTALVALASRNADASIRAPRTLETQRPPAHKPRGKVAAVVVPKAPRVPSSLRSLDGAPSVLAPSSRLPEATESLCKMLGDADFAEGSRCPTIVRWQEAKTSDEAHAWKRRFGSYRAAWDACRKATGTETKFVYETAEMTAERRRSGFFTAGAGR